VSDTDGLTDEDSIEVMVRDLSVEPAGNLIALYLLNGDAQDASDNANHGTPGGVSWVADKEESPQKAARFNGFNSFIQVPNNDMLNFQEALTIACWIKIDEFLLHEQHPVSHGSWQNRYKISIGDQKIRFTVKTADRIKDLDSETVPETGQWIHLAAVYNGTDMEIWLDGKLDAFTNQTGLINKTAFDLVMGQNLPGDNNNNFKGTLDAVAVFDYGLSQAQILEHMENSVNLALPGSVSDSGKRHRVFPNPVTASSLNIEIHSLQSETISFKLFDVSGKQAGEWRYFHVATDESSYPLPVDRLKNGIYILSITGKEWSAFERIIVLR
jgi:hypothetical protein